MAITLVTGLPGHGKTLYSLFRWKAEAEKDGRPVFHNGIPGLNIMGWQVWDVKDWQQLPANALLIVDEAWDDFPIRGRGEPPAHIGELARHRHLGIDIVLIAQDPMLIDSFVRRLIDRHFHIVRKFGTHWATIHEYANGVKESVAKGRGDSIKHEWRYPQEVFGWYTSSEQHTVKRRIPARVWLLLAIPFVLLALGIVGYQKLRPEYVAQQAQGKVAGASGGVFHGVGAAPSQSGRDAQGRGLSPVEYAQSFTPRVQGLPHTAPVYDDVTRPIEAPYPAACLNMPSKHRCTCYTQQATKLDVPPQICEQIAAGGFFLAWKQQVVNAVPVQAPPAAAAVPQLAGGFGGQSAPVVVAAGPEVVDDGPPRPHVRR